MARVTIAISGLLMFLVVMNGVTRLKCLQTITKFDWVFAVDQQCENFGYLGACIEADPANVCAHLRCANDSMVDGLILGIQVGRALDGTTCGKNKQCHEGNCEAADKLIYNIGGHAEYYCAVQPD